MGYDNYLEVISLIERLHRSFLDVVKLELDGCGGNYPGDKAESRGYSWTANATLYS